MIRHLLSLASPLVIATALFAQPPKINFPGASPACTLKQRVGLTDIEIKYSRPSAKGRVMLGGIDPYGQVWRTGANDATTIAFSTPVKLNGNQIAPGTYGLFTIPGESEWTIILSKTSKQWGAYKYDPKDDVLRFTAKPVPLSTPVESFTIEFGNFTVSQATLNLAWEKTSVPIEVTADVSAVVARIDEVMAGEGPKPYLPVAQFYYDAGLDPKKALTWVDAAFAKKAPTYNQATLRAKLLARAGLKDEAISQAKAAIELAKEKGAEPARSEYIRLNEEVIREVSG
jgi:hypothetical protein